MRLTQFNALTAVHHKRRLPERPTVESMYKRLLLQGVTMAAQVRANPRDKMDSAMEVRGVLGEMAVLLLAQRYALREVGCEEWLPLQSLFSEDNGGNCLAKTDDYAWDMNILTPTDDAPETTYKLEASMRVKLQMDRPSISIPTWLYTRMNH